MIMRFLLLFCFFFKQKSAYVMRISDWSSDVCSSDLTAFRGFGGPQGMIGGERLIEEIAFALGKDPLEVRKLNLYGPGRDIAPYHQQVEDNIAPEIIAKLEDRKSTRLNSSH